jgi:multidrug resistance efflux pump
MKKAIYRLIVLAIVVGGGWYGYHYYKNRPEKASSIATATVQRGDVVIRAYTRGQLNAVRVFPLYAPNLNGTVQVTQLAAMGSLAKEKDLIVEYDDSELQAFVDSEKLSLDGTDQNIKAQRLSQDITRSRDVVALLSAQFGVKKASLNVQQIPVVSAIIAKQYVLAQEQAKRTLEQQALDNQMREALLDSQLAVFMANRQRAATDLQTDQARLKTVKTLAPMSGMVAIKQNKAGNFNFGMQMPDIRQGDELQAGMNVADLLDLSEMNLSAKIGEMDRANLKEGQEMTFQLDSIPDKRFPGKIKTLSGTAATDVFSGDPSKKFDVTFSIDMRALLAGLGMKPADVDRIMNQAAENASKNLVSLAPVMGGGRGGGGPGGPDMGAMDPALLMAMRSQQAAPGGQAGQGGAQAGGQGGAQAGGRGGDQAGGQGRGRGSTPTLSDADRQKLAEIGKQLLTATGADRDKLQAQMDALMPQQGRGRGGQGRGQGGGGGGGDMAGGQGRGQGGSGGGRGGDMAGGGQGGPGGAGGGRGQPSTTAAMPNYTDDDRDNAKLPLPPDKDTDIALLLRPGLLADVEIEVERIPNALHVPQQAVFEKGGQSLVYVQTANGKFSPRVVKVMKQSETTMVLESGVEPGELVALQDPTANKAEKGKAEETKKPTSATSMMPGGK